MATSETRQSKFVLRLENHFDEIEELWNYAPKLLQSSSITPATTMILDDLDIETVHLNHHMQQLSMNGNRSQSTIDTSSDTSLFLRHIDQLVYNYLNRSNRRFCYQREMRYSLSQDDIVRFYIVFGIRQFYQPV